MKDNCPLVSLVVITYNSSQTVLETLDSMKTQSYPNLELIISDDCSKDNTVDIVQKWLEANSSYFQYSALITSPVNTGVCANLNRGIRASHGEWIKSIAGDDLLIPSAIDEYVGFITRNTDEIKMCVSDVKLFTNEGEVPRDMATAYQRLFEFESEAYDNQKRTVMTRLVFVGPSYFYSKKLFESVGGFEEKYGNAEEWPFVYKVIMRGNRIYAINKKLVCYRVSSSSLCHSRDDNGLKNKSVFMGMYQHYFDHAFKDLIFEGRVLTAWHHALLYWSHRSHYSIRSTKRRQIVNKFFLAFSPLAWYRKLASILDM